MQGVNQTTSAPNTIAKTCRLETISRAGSPNVTHSDAMLKIWPVVVMIAALTFAVRQGGPSASSMPQNDDPALACTALVRRSVIHRRSPIPPA